jgi:hypothetical protein
MSRRSRKTLPVILGGGRLRKGLLVVRNPKMGGADLAVVFLKREVPTGQRFGTEDVEGIDAVLHFCNETAVDAVAKALEAVRQTIRDGEVPEQTSSVAPGGAPLTGPAGPLLGENEHTGSFSEPSQPPEGKA